MLKNVLFAMMTFGCAKHVTIQCQKTREGAPPWNKYNVIAITNPQIEEPLAAHPICMDPYARVYIQERP